jgi:hypothetical protein
MRIDAPGDAERKSPKPHQALGETALSKDLEYQLSDSRRELAGLDESTTAERWPKVPPHASSFLRNQCAEGEKHDLFVLAMEEAAQLPEAILANPSLAPSFLKGCIDKAEIAARTDRINAKEAENAASQSQIEAVQAENAALTNEEAQVNTTNEGLSKREELASAEIDQIFAEEAAKGGGVDALIGRVSERLKAMAPGTAKQAAEQKMAQVQATLGQMRSVVTNPQERQAFESILSSTSLNLGGSNNYQVFADVMMQVDASDAISEETKDRLKVEALGIPPIHRASELQGTLTQIRQNDGTFRNKHGKVGKLSADNGIPVGRYKVHPDPNDASEYVATAKVGGRTLTLPFGINDDPNLLDERMSTAMIAQVLANRDLQGANRYILGGDGLAAQGVERIGLDEFQVKRAEQLYGAFMGFGTELKTGFPSQSNLQEFERRLQATHIDGDAKTNDNTGRGDLSWKEIGMLDASGEINMAKVEAVGSYINQAPVSLPAYQSLVDRFGADAPAIPPL